MTSGEGYAFTHPVDGDIRGDLGARERVSRRWGISPEWSTSNQVHGAVVAETHHPGNVGPADGQVTTVERLPLAVFTADCLGVVLQGPGTVGVAHAGWRGLASGVIEETIRVMSEVGSEPVRGWIGPGIGPCCFEVGEDVRSHFPEDLSETTWGTMSVDLAAAALRRLDGIEMVVDRRCTACQGGLSHRRDRTPARMAAVGWVAA